MAAAYTRLKPILNSFLANGGGRRCGYRAAGLRVRGCATAQEAV